MMIIELDETTREVGVEDDDGKIYVVIFNDYGVTITNEDAKIISSKEKVYKKILDFIDKEDNRKEK